MADRTITTDLVGRDRMSPAADSAARSSSRLGGVLGKVGGVMKTGLAVGAGVAVGGIAALGGWIVQGVKDAASYQTVLAKTAQVIKSTGNVAHISVEGVKSLAAELETMSGVDEELIINSQNVLATFTNIRNVGKNKIFDQATKSALDMSVALGTDLQGASIQVGKALNDPIKGVSALSKVGVTFTDSQKKVIKSLVETGDVAGAQKVILAELNKEFGGQAAAAGKGFEGSMARVQDVLADTGREIGTALLPKVTQFAEWLSKKIPVAIDATKKGWNDFVSAFNGNPLNVSTMTELGSETDAVRRSWSDLMNVFNTSTPQIQASSKALDGETKSVAGLFAAIGASVADIGSYLRTGILAVQEFGEKVQQKALETVLGIQEKFAKLPGPVGEKFKRMARETRGQLDNIQARIDRTNTKQAQGKINDLTTKIQRLGRQRPTPKVSANIRAAQDQIARIQAKLRGIKDEYVAVYVSEIHRDAAMAGRNKNRASGGPVTAGTVYNVGEAGPETFVPSVSGRIIPNQRAAGAGGGGRGGDTYIIEVHGVGERALGDAVVAALERRPAGARKIPARAVGGR